MSVMLGVIEHPLKPIIDHILARSTPEDERDDLKVLLDSTVLYIKRVEKGSLTNQERIYPSHQNMRFSEITLSKQLADSLKDRIRIIYEYDIRSIPRIQEIMLIGLVRTPYRIFSEVEISLLGELAKTPMANISQLARKLNYSRYRISQLLRRLEEENGLRRLYSENRGKLKLTTFSCVFQTQSFKEAEALEAWVRQTPLPFLTAMVFNVTYTTGYMSFAIPSQQRAHQLFQNRIRWLKRNYFSNSHTHHVREMYWNIRFDLYDTDLGKWRLPSELKEIERVEDPGDHGLKNIVCKHHKDFRTPVHLRQIDCFLANLGISAHHSLNDIAEMAANHGFALSKNSIWFHLQRLKKEQVILPMMYFSGGGFEEFILLSILCDPPTRRQLQVLASWFPAAFTYPSEQGISIFIKHPIGWRDTLATILQDISQEYNIQDPIIVHQERNIGSSLDPAFFRRWNEDRQYWKFTEKEI